MWQKKLSGITQDCVLREDLQPDPVDVRDWIDIGVDPRFAEKSPLSSELQTSSLVVRKGLQSVTLVSRARQPLL